MTSARIPRRSPARRVSNATREGRHEDAVTRRNRPRGQPAPNPAQRPTTIGSATAAGRWRFGSKTLARVKEFQQKNGLQVDGIVGPQTSAALRTIPKPSDRLAFLCGNGDPANRGIAASIRQAVLAAGGQQGPSPTQSQGFVPAAGTGAFPLILGFRRLAPLTPPQEATATGVYGASLDFTRIRITDARSPTGRPFTMSSFQLVGPTLQIMVLGTFSPSPQLLIHELAHVWQSQHHVQADAFESNCLASQGEAATKTSFLRLTRRSVLTRSGRVIFHSPLTPMSREKPSVTTPESRSPSRSKRGNSQLSRM